MDFWLSFHKQTLGYREKHGNKTTTNKQMQVPWELMAGVGAGQGERGFS